MRACVRTVYAVVNLADAQSWSSVASRALQPGTAGDVVGLAAWSERGAGPFDGLADLGVEADLRAAGRALRRDKGRAEREQSESGELHGGCRGGRMDDRVATSRRSGRSERQGF